MTEALPKPFVAVACGGTGGHLFPGLAVAEVLKARGCDIALLISPKEVDQQAIRAARDMQVVTLPAVALQPGQIIGFVRGFWQSFRAARKLFRKRPPQAVLAMGGFTSAPPIFAAGLCGAATFLHESNTLPGRANRWLAPWVEEAFIGFAEAARRLRCARVTHTGTPVRPQFQPLAGAACRLALGLDAQRPVLLVMGGSQGARSINELVVRTLPKFNAACPELQIVHLTGPDDFEKVRAAYLGQSLRAIVHPFFTGMELALGAATLALSRAGASSLAELAAMRVPAILVPYPAATDNHQSHNARAYSQTGAARTVEQRDATPESLASLVLEFLKENGPRLAMREALARWHTPHAAEQVAECILRKIGAGQRVKETVSTNASGASSQTETHELQSAIL